MFALVKVKFYVWYFKRHSLVGLRCDKHVLVLGVRLLNFLLKARHDSELWLARLVKYQFWKLKFK